MTPDVSFELVFRVFDRSARAVFKIKREVREIGILPPAGNELIRVWHEVNVLADPWTYPQLHKKYEALEHLLSAELGFPVYFESINPAVSALYRV